MSTFAGQLESASTLPAERVLERRLTRYLIAIGGLLTGVGACVLVATSDHLVDPIAYGLLLADVIIGTVAVAIYWLVRRPGSRMALILLVLAAAYVGISLQGAASPLLHSIGVLFDPVVFTLTYYAVFAFPHGRLVSPLDKLLVAAPLVAILTSFLPLFLFSPYVSGASPLAHCNTACPRNALMIADRPSIAAGLGRTEEILLVAVAAAIVGAIVYRLDTATRPRRRALLPVYVPALFLTVPFGIFHAAKAGLIDLGPDALSRVGWGVTVGRGTLAYGFLLSIVLATMFAGRALKDAVAGLGNTRHPAYLRSILAAALDDSSLDLAFRDTEHGGFVDTSGQPLDPGRAGDGRLSSPVERGGETIAYIVHDASLTGDPELVHVAGQALLLALESGRLEAELGSTIEELRGSRARIAAAGHAERRKIERDLHDGAQQHLFALGMKLDLAARDVAAKDPELAKELSGVGEELSQVLDDLRQLARGAYPSALRDFGLEKALTSAAWRSPQPAKFSATDVGRYPPELEAAVYFCCLESLQNVARHAGADARAEIRLWTANGDLCFTVEDDGVGFESGAVREGSGFANMDDRLAVFGGALTVEARSPRGTTVRGSVPLTGSRRDV
ncbi:MAG: sensor histidine kinase [Gaiellaceae bacterium]